MRHFLVMCLFAALSAIVFGAMAKDTPRERWLYGLKVFAEFIVIGLAYVLARRGSEHPPVLSAELGWALVAYAKRSLTRVQPFAHH